MEYSRFGGMTPEQKAEMYAHDIIGNLNGGINGSIDWNLLLDAAGGPNHAGNYYEAPVMLNSDCNDFTLKSEYYYIGQFSRYIQPGAVRIGISAWCSAIEATAFENPDGSIAAAILNRTDVDIPISFTRDGKTDCKFILRAHSLCTVLQK